MPKIKDISILDVTIRDGSYAIDYQYEPEKVAAIAKALDEAGVDFIEVSHGCGLGASENLGFRARATDAQYVRAARDATKRIKIGVIAGPEPTTFTRDIDTIIYDVDFIRFAANVDDPDSVESNIRYARKKRKDLMIFFQLMRSNRASKKQILTAAKRIESMGVDTLYVVDTAGHMLPEETAEIISELSSALRMRIGFHGHDNLSLAIANTLAAVDAGAMSVDASLKGVGRSAGNAQLEVLVSLLQRKGLLGHIDLDALLIAGDTEVEPLMRDYCKISSIDIITANANIDVYPLVRYEEIADKANINLLDLIAALGKDSDVVEANTESLLRALKKLGVKNPEGVLSPDGAKAANRKKIIPDRGGSIDAVLALKTSIATLDFPDEMGKWLMEKFPNVKFHVTKSSCDKIRHIEKAQVLFAYELTPATLLKAKELRWFHSVVTGPDAYPFPELIERKILVTSPRGVYSVPIAETVIGMMLALSRKIRDSIVLQSQRTYDSRHIMEALPPMSELMGSTALIIGLGGVGTAVAMRCKSLGMCVIGAVAFPRPKPSCVDEQVIFERMEEVLGLADFVILSCPLTRLTKGMIDESRLRKMKTTSCLINVARSGLVDEVALSDALKRGKIGGAACDVFSVEPLPGNHPFYSAPNMIVTPHISGISTNFWSRAVARFAANLNLYLAGEKLIGEVDFERGY